MSSSFGLSCPAGGKFYICTGSTNEFVGCCTSNPCAAGKGICPQNNIKPLSYSGDSFKDIPAQACSNSTAQWYSCQKNTPPFLGCCTSNPCTSGSCPASRLSPAKLSTNSTARAAFLSGSPQTTTRSSTSTKPATSATGTSKSTSATTTTTTTPTGSTLPSNQTPGSSGGGGLSTGAVVGIVVGIAVIVFIIVAFIAYKRGWYARKRKERDSYTVPFITGGMAPYDSAAPPPMPPKLASHSPAFGQFAHPPAPTPVPPYGSPPLPGTPPSNQQLYPMHAAAKVPPRSSPLSSNPESAHSSPRMGGYHGSTHSRQLSELEVPLMLSELPSNEPGLPHMHGGSAPVSLRPASGPPQRWNTTTSSELHMWDGGGGPRQGY